MFINDKNSLRTLISDEKFPSGNLFFTLTANS